MQLNAADTLAGLPILKIRAFFRKTRAGWNVKYLAKGLGLAADQAEQVLAELAREGYIEPFSQSSGFWEITEKARRLVLAKASKPVQRATAARALEQFLERVAAANQEARFIFRVTEVRVFGSFLS